MEGKGERGGEDDGEQLLHDVRRERRCVCVCVREREHVQCARAHLGGCLQPIGFPSSVLFHLFLFLCFMVVLSHDNMTFSTELRTIIWDNLVHYL